MGDTSKFLDTTQIVNGIALLLSFFVGYKCAQKKFELNKLDEAAAGTTNKNDETSESNVVLTDTEGPLYMSWSNNYKMVLVVRNDLKMGKGKIAAQCGHGAVGAYQKAARRAPSLVRAWENTGCAKIALKVESEPEMMSLKKAAEEKGLVTCLIRDAGRTQIAPNSKTVLAIGPGNVNAIDLVTGHLKLL